MLMMDTLILSDLVLGDSQEVYVKAVYYDFQDDNSACEGSRGKLVNTIIN